MFYSNFSNIPEKFFNRLTSNANRDLFLGSLLAIYELFETEISYRIKRRRIRDIIIEYMLETNIDYKDENGEEKFHNKRSAIENANSVIGAMIDCGWIEEETEVTSYEKIIIMTDNGISLAEFIERITVQKREEYSSYVFNIYNTIVHKEQWENDPYVGALKNIFGNAKNLSKALKRLSTGLKKSAKEIVDTTTVEEVANHIIDYCDGTFIREYFRLTKINNNNIRIYRRKIIEFLDYIENDEEMNNLLVIGCFEEEDLNEEQEACVLIHNMIQHTRRFLTNDYDDIMEDIKSRINRYIRMAVSRVRFLGSQKKDTQGNVSTVLKRLIHNLDETNMKDILPKEYTSLFNLDNSEFIDEGSLKYPTEKITITTNTTCELEEITEDELINAKNKFIDNSQSLYSKELIKSYTEQVINGKEKTTASEFAIREKEDLLLAMAVTTYADANGYEIEPAETFITFDNGNYKVRDFSIRRRR